MSLLVLERKPRNGAVLARESGLRLHQVRSHKQLLDAFFEIRPVACAIEIASASETDVLTVMHLVTELKRHRTGVVVMPAFQLRYELDALFYEAGCDAILTSMLDIDRVRKLFRRCLQRNSEIDGKDQPELTIRRWVSERLPWKRFASGSSH